MYEKSIKSYTCTHKMFARPLFRYIHIFCRVFTNLQKTCINSHHSILHTGTSYDSQQISSRFSGKSVLHKITGSRCQNTSSEFKLDMNQHLYSIPVNTCSEIYRLWYEAGIAKNKPLRGVDFDVVYFDNQPKAASHTPVIVALHGSAGSHLHFSHLLPYLNETGARIIIPNFPGAGRTPKDKNRYFSHSDQERACFIADFLATINVSKVDVLLAHSAGIYPAMYLMKNQEMFRSVVLLCPGGHRPSRLMRPLWFFQLAASLMSYSLISIIVSSIKPFYRSYTNEIKIDNHLLEVAIRSALFVNFYYVEESLKEFALQRLPVILAYAKNDTAVSQKIFQEIVQFLQFTDDDIFSYDTNGKLICPELKLTSKWRPRCLVFEDGGHFIMNAHPQIIGKAILELLEHLNKKKF